MTLDPLAPLGPRAFPPSPAPLRSTLANTGSRFDFQLLEEWLSIWVKMVYSNAGIKQLWGSMLCESVEGFSTVRWHCKAMIIMQQAKGFGWIQHFLAKLKELQSAETLRGQLSKIYRENAPKLKLQMAAILDMKVIVTTTYTLEGDGLLILLAFAYIEELRALGRQLDHEGSLPNVEAVLRNSAELKLGLVVKKVWAGYGNCSAKVISIDKAESTLCVAALLRAPPRCCARHPAAASNHPAAASNHLLTQCLTAGRARPAEAAGAGTGRAPRAPWRRVAALLRLHMCAFARLSPPPSCRLRRPCSSPLRACSLARRTRSCSRRRRSAVGCKHSSPTTAESARRSAAATPRPSRS